MGSKPLAAAPNDLGALQEQLKALTLPHFTADDAFTIGVSLRTRLRNQYPSTPAVVSITHANSDQLLFHACSVPGVNPDNDIWVARKRKTVKRWGVSTWLMGRKFEMNEDAFAKKYVLGASAGEYAIHGGGIPVRVAGVEGLVGVIVVSGLKPDQDHMIVVEALQDFIAADLDAKKV